jgi:NAD(P)H-hydrate epimerase
MIVVGSAEMRAIDRHAVEIVGIPAAILMENAGRAVAAAIEGIFRPPAGKKVVVLCGRGNNGGDGFVIARTLFRSGISAQVWTVSQPRDLKGEARLHHGIFVRAGGRTRLLTPPSKARFARDIAESDLVVDALFGTGLNAPIAGFPARVIDAVNASGRPVVSVDVPSGIDADTGAVLGTAVRASLTITFGHLKAGLVLPPGSIHAGRVEVADIGLPETSTKRVGPRGRVLAESEAAALLPVRPASGHKGTFGRVLIAAGSTGKTGAAVLASLGALRGGAGLVTIAHPAAFRSVFEQKTLEAMTLPVGKDGDTFFNLSAVDSIRAAAAGADAAVIGPGIGLAAGTAEAVSALVRAISCPLVLDADALTLLAGKEAALRRRRQITVLTPHPGEMARLIGGSVEQVQKDRVGAARDAAGRYGAVVILKGAGTVTASPDGRYWINRTGNAGMATGGTGDVLAGLIAALLAGGLPVESAAPLAVFIHGLAGDLAAEARGTTGLIASDLARKIPLAFKRVHACR